MSRSRRGPGLVYRIACGSVAAASAIVPSSYRDRFRREWTAELWHLREKGARSSRMLLRTLGVFRDALATRGLVNESEERLCATSRSPGREIMLSRDFRLALRSCFARKGWATVAILTLAVGIGANTAIFSLIRAVLLRPLGYEEPERLVKIRGLDLEDAAPSNLSPEDFYDLAAESETFASMGAHGWVGFFTITAPEPERVPGSSVTAGFFETLGVFAARGRLFTPEDDRPEAPRTVILTHTLWETRFGSRADVLGEMVRIDAQLHEIVGILPADYVHPEPYPDREPLLYTLYRFDRAVPNRGGHFIRAVGRLRKGRSIEEARAELTAIAARLERTYPETNTDRGVHLAPLHEAIVGEARGGLLVLYGAVGAVLLIACANLANLQLAHGSSRRQALAIHAALGARRGRLIRQLLLESWILAAAGGVLGFLLAFAVRDLLAQRAIPRAVELDFDLTVLGFSLALATATAMLFGLAPALSLSSEGVRGSLVEGGSRGASARTGGRRALVAVEVALSLLLLVSAGLFLRSLSHLRSVPAGFRTESVSTLSVSLPLARYEEGEQIPFYESLFERVRALAGVQAVGATNILPLTNNYSTDGFQIDDRPAPRGQSPAAEARSVSPGYFDAMGIPLLRGRLFDERDRAGSPGVVMVSDSMARKFWPEGDALGKRITYNRGIPENLQREVGGPGSREIVGIVGDVKHLDLEGGDVPMFYTPQAHQPSFHTMTLVVRSSTPTESVAAGVFRELHALDPEIPVYAVRSLQSVLDGSVTEERFRTALLALFAALALGLAALGVYAVMGLAVVERQREIGIRMALGADSTNVARMLVRESMEPVLWGLLAGGIAAFFVTRSLESLLFGVKARDPLTFAAVAGILAVSALLAALAPTLRAARMDPVKTLRTE